MKNGKAAQAMGPQSGQSSQALGTARGSSTELRRVAGRLKTYYPDIALAVEGLAKVLDREATPPSRKTAVLPPKGAPQRP